MELWLTAPVVDEDAPKRNPPLVLPRRINQVLHFPFSHLQHSVELIVTRSRATYPQDTDSKGFNKPFKQIQGERKSTESLGKVFPLSMQKRVKFVKIITINIVHSLLGKYLTSIIFTPKRNLSQEYQNYM